MDALGLGGLRESNEILAIPVLLKRIKNEISAFHSLIQFHFVMNSLNCSMYNKVHCLYIGKYNMRTY